MWYRVSFVVLLTLAVISTVGLCLQTLWLLIDPARIGNNAMTYNLLGLGGLVVGLGGSLFVSEVLYPRDTF